MFFFNIRKISVLGNVLRQKNWSSQRLLRMFARKNWARTSVNQLLKKIDSTGVTERPKASGRPR